MIFYFAHCPTYQGHSEGPQQFSTPSGGPPKELLYKIPVGPIQPTLLPKGLDLWWWWDVSTFAVKLSGKRVYPE